MQTTWILSALLTAMTAGLFTAVHSPGTAAATLARAQPLLGDEGPMPELVGATVWLNSPPLTTKSLRGKVVVVDIWTYSCINSLRQLPYLESWAAKYKNQGLVVIGVHAPEFAFEKNVANVTRAVHDLGITYPVALDNDYAIWKAFNNQYWPAHYFIDAAGRIRGHHFGEGDYPESEQLLRQLLTEAGATHLPADTGGAAGTGVEAASDQRQVSSPETYVGYERAANFASSGGEVADRPHAYTAPHTPQLNQWGLSGSWRVEAERAVAISARAGIVFRFRARDLHLVLGPPDAAHAIRFRVTVDGHAPGDDHGTDVTPDGAGTVTEQRLYQLLRQSGGAAEHTFAIEFLDPGVQAYSFTFG